MKAAESYVLAQTRHAFAESIQRIGDLDSRLNRVIFQPALKVCLGHRPCVEESFRRAASFAHEPARFVLPLDALRDDLAPQAAAERDDCANDRCIAVVTG